MKLSLAIQTPEVAPLVPVALLTGTFEEKLAKAARLGVEGVELMVADPARLDAAAIRRSLQASGLRAAAIGSGAVAFATGLTLLHADASRSAQAGQRLRDLIGLAAAVGAPLVTIGSFRGRLASAGVGARASLVSILQDAGQAAASLGVRLALEPLNRYEADVLHTAEEGLAFLAEVAHPAVGLLLDTYHVNIEERSWSEPFRRLLAAGALWHVHLGDNNRLPPGQGLIDFRSIVGALREGGYDGYLSAELLARPDPDTAAEQTVRYMRGLMHGS